MRKNSIIFILIIYGLWCGIISCKKTDSNEINLIGIWESTKVDSLLHFITPVKPDSFISGDYKKCILEINEDSSFRMTNSRDTIIGTWNKTSSDSLKLKVNDIQGKFLYTRESKIESFDRDNLILIDYGGSISGGLFDGHSGFSITEETKYEAKVYYVRKLQN
jgi:hypothetical protein